MRCILLCGKRKIGARPQNCWAHTPTLMAMPSSNINTNKHLKTKTRERRNKWAVQGLRGSCEWWVGVDAARDNYVWSNYFACPATTTAGGHGGNNCFVFMFKGIWVRVQRSLTWTDHVISTCTCILGNYSNFEELHSSRLPSKRLQEDPPIRFRFLWLVRGIWVLGVWLCICAANAASGSVCVLRESHTNWNRRGWQPFRLCHWVH